MSQIIALGSGKGGVGKTWLAISLAQALARLGRRVLLFDADLGLANVDIQLGLNPARDLSDALAGRAPLEMVVQRFAPGGFDLILGRSGSGQLAILAPERLDALLVELRAVARAYDVVLLDLPAGLDLAVRRVLTSAAWPLVVTTDEPTALTDAYALIKVAHTHRLTGLPRIAVNQAPSQQAGRHTYDGLLRVCERFLHLGPPLAGVVRRDPRVPDAIRHQVPLLSRHPLSLAARDVEALARAVVGAP